MKRILLSILFATLFAANSASANPTPTKISNVSRSIFYRDNKAWVGWNGRAGLNGGDYTDNLFNENFTDYRYQNTAGAYIVVDTTLHDGNGNSTGVGYYVTDILVGHKGNTKYSLYYTTEPPPDYSGLELKSSYDDNNKVWTYYYETNSDARVWIPVPNATGVQIGGVTTNGVNLVATAVKYVFDTSAGWGGQSLAEIEIQGIDPSQITCTHEGYLTDWEEIPGTANCTDFGYEQQQCTNCGEWFRHQAFGALPLGHDYEAVLVKRGTSLAYGSGTNVCKRCYHEVAFPEPLNLVELGGFTAAGVVQFTDVSVSSTCHPEWGIQPDYLFNGNWTMDWKAYWAAASNDHDEYVEFAFAAPVDLTKVEFSVPNHDHVVQFYSVEGDEEILVGEVSVEQNTASDAPNYQRFNTEFRGTTLSKLRVRTVDPTGFTDTWNIPTMAIGEIYPYGTVNGAGKSAAVRTRIIIE